MKSLITGCKLLQRSYFVAIDQYIIFHVSS